ncbi:hypothetical protein C8J57DRAFT_1223556 [Mycena rebaudengoi]|nr:hypothetical protein C8J57DRAFT_1223556 [Mycena rebaudengoi]
MKLNLNVGQELHAAGHVHRPGPKPGSRVVPNPEPDPEPSLKSGSGRAQKHGLGSAGKHRQILPSPFLLGIPPTTHPTPASLGLAQRAVTHTPVLHLHRSRMFSNLATRLGTWMDITNYISHPRYCPQRPILPLPESLGPRGLGYGFPDVGTRLKQFPILLTDVTETGAITKLYERYGGDGDAGWNFHGGNYRREQDVRIQWVDWLGIFSESNLFILRWAASGATDAT